MSFNKGYACSFKNTFTCLELLLPSREDIIDGLRRHSEVFPFAIVKELVVNALVHQDFRVTGSHTLVEIFDDRVEITNTGIPLVALDRIIDAKPESRNTKLACLLRRLSLASDEGSGWDNIAILCEEHKIPAPMITTYADTHTKVVLYKAKAFKDFTLQERLWSLYVHCAVCFKRGKSCTYKSLCERFDLKENAVNQKMLANLIKIAEDKGLIKAVDPNALSPDRSYIPAWSY